ncbi:MAG: MBL fold metallo-hydrolase [Deltaproteobacteria bacterium]|nr:MBL fold metallo-hydrolase [Deltaproteobacteria bacterium]
MKRLFQLIAAIIFFVFIFLITVVSVKTIEVDKGKKLAEQEYKKIPYNAFENFGSVTNLSITPIIDYMAAEPGLKTEIGVSYVIRADDTVILMDLGLNQHGEHPSPLLQNMEKLGFKINDINILYISHLHPNHIGGLTEMGKQTFSLTRGKLDMSKVNAYTPVEMNNSELTPVGKIITKQNPFILKPGIGSIGAIPRYLYIMGKVYEQSLAVNVRGKGIVLIIGGGCQGIDKILERTRTLFKEPIYAIIGGLNYPVHGGRSMAGPFDIQYIVGADAPPWRGLKEADVLSAIELIKKTNAEIIAVSPHNSSDWALGRFREHLGKRVIDLKVGMEIKI